MKRCIICKKEIIEFGEKHFTGFQSIFPPKEFDKACYFILGDGSSGPYYPFAQRSETGSFRHLCIERGFWNEQIHLRLNSVYVSYLKYDWSAAMCAYGVSNYSGYGRLSSIPEKYTVCSPWFDTENDKDSLQKGLVELGAWYVEHLPEINLSYEKQQTWLDKDYRDAKITRAYCLYNGVKTLAFQAKPLGQPHTSKFRKKKYRDTKLEVKKWKTIESQHIVRMISNIT